MQSQETFPGRSFPLVWLLVITALYIALRLPHIGHPLAWDEAWILCAVKSLAEGVDTGFQGQLWRHPPIYLGLGLLLAPLKQDFAQRMEMLSLIIHTGAFLIFVLFIAQIQGRRLALFTGIAYAMLPGSIFYSTWIKRDSLVIFFCVLAIWAFFKKRDLLAGIFLGLGFLSKESAVFYAIAVLIMIPFYRRRNSIARSLLFILAPVLIISGWWYLFYATGTKGHLSFFQGVSEETSLFAKPGWYYFSKLKHDLGIPGLTILAAGLIAFFPHNITFINNLRIPGYLKKNRFLPLYFLFPSYLILTISRGKPPWMTIVFFPFLALVVGLGWQFLLRIAADIIKRVFGKGVTIHPVLSGMLLIAVLSVPLIHFNYMKYLTEISPGTANVIQRSYGIAEAVNQSSDDNDKILLMPMIIQPHLKTQPDPILFWRLKPSLRLYRVNRLGLDFTGVKEIIVTEQINRLLIFGLEESNQEKIITQIIKEINPAGLSLPGKILVLDVSGYWKGKKTVN